MTVILGAGERRLPAVVFANLNTAAHDLVFAALGSKKDQDDYWK
jgi:hypothetical protein